MNQLVDQFMGAERTREMTLLIVDDNRAYAGRLARAMQRRGFEVRVAASVKEGRALIHAAAPAFAVVDLRLEDGFGLDVISLLREERPKARAVVVTGYGNFTTVVAAMKVGAVNYLAKPVEADEIAAALLNGVESNASPPDSCLTYEAMKWECIQRVYERCGRNVSETARQLGMHRRTLQRILNKHAPKYNAQ